MKSIGVVIAGLVLLVIFAAVLIFGWGAKINNRIVRLDQNADSQWAQVQNVYQRRYDLIPNLVATVQGAANFEKSTLTEVVQARASVGKVQIDANKAPNNPQTLQQFQAAQDHLSSALSRLLVVSERYPELKATANFRDLQAQLEGTENRISVERGRFNDAVRDYDTYIKQFPASMVASARNFQPKPYFQGTSGSEKPPEVKFDFGSSKAGASTPAEAPAK
jgi:LemA protein